MIKVGGVCAPTNCTGDDAATSSGSSVFRRKFCRVCSCEGPLSKVVTGYARIVKAGLLSEV